VESRAAASRKLESRRRRLANVYTLVEPHAGQQVDYGSTINIQWSVNNDGYQRVELWRYGSFVTRLYNSMYGYANHIKEINWHVTPGPNVDSADMTINANKSFMALQPKGTLNGWKQFFHNFQPGDRYTVRVCSYSDNEDEEICDDTYGESGEFNINAVVRMLSPVQTQLYKPGDFIPITWQSYFVNGNKVNINMKLESRIVWSKQGITDTGAYTFYVPPDMKPGLYTIEVVGMEPGSAPCVDSATFSSVDGLGCSAYENECKQTSMHYVSECNPRAAKQGVVTGGLQIPPLEDNGYGVQCEVGGMFGNGYASKAFTDAIRASCPVSCATGVANKVDNWDNSTTVCATFASSCKTTSAGSSGLFGYVDSEGNHISTDNWAGPPYNYPKKAWPGVLNGALGPVYPSITGGYTQAPNKIGGQIMGNVPLVHGYITACNTQTVLKGKTYTGYEGAPVPAPWSRQCQPGTMWRQGVYYDPFDTSAIRTNCPVSCGTCPATYSAGKVYSCESSTCQTQFTMGAHPPPPPSPSIPGQVHGEEYDDDGDGHDGSWEVPIIQAFRGSFGLDEVQFGPGPATAAQPGGVSAYTSTSARPSNQDPAAFSATSPGGLNCAYVCHVYNQANGGGGRRLLFGGLQYYDPVDTNTFVGCSADMKTCGCCNNPPIGQNALVG
jgi:hypothetical protein